MHCISRLCRGRSRTAMLLALGAIATAIACSSDRTTRPGSSLLARIAEGNAQYGEPGAPLPSDIIVRVTDASGNLLSGIDVAWKAADGGHFTPAVSSTDASGRASARWTLGPQLAQHRATAHIDGLPAIEITATSTLSSPGGEITLLHLETYDGSNQTVHPDFAAGDAAWPAPRRYLAITPYPNGNAYYENPSFYESDLGQHWQAPAGGKNPVVTGRPPDYLSDPDVVFDPARREFRLYYREVTEQNLIWMMRSSDGARWSARRLVASGLNHTIVSPAVVRRSANEWLMWSVNANAGCSSASTNVELRKSSDGITWSSPQQTDMTGPGLSAWHVDVQWMADRNEYWALFNPKQPGSCTTQDLYLATSRDGITWKTFPTPVLSVGAIPEFEDIVYRSTFTYDPLDGSMTFWFSGARYDGGWVWRSAVQRRLRAEVLDHVSSARAATKALTSRRFVPPLMDPP